MSYDEQPDAPLHGECAAEISRMENEVRSWRDRCGALQMTSDALVKERDSLQQQITAMHSVHQAVESKLRACSMPDVDCRTCANRGVTDGNSQESHCSHCIYQEQWRTNHYAPKEKKDLPQSASLTTTGPRCLGQYDACPPGLLHGGEYEEKCKNHNKEN